MHQHTIFWEQQQSCFSWDDEDFSSFIEFHFIAKNCSLQTKLVKLCILQKNLGKYSNITCENFLKTHKRHLCTKNVWLMIMFIIVAWVNKMLYLTRNVLSHCLKITKKVSYYDFKQSFGRENSNCKFSKWDPTIFGLELGLVSFKTLT